MVKQGKRGKQVKRRGKSSKKPLVKGKGSAKKRVSKRRSSKGKKTPRAHGRPEEIRALVNRDFPHPLTNKDVLEINQIVEEAIRTSPYTEKYDALNHDDTDAIKAELKIEAQKLKKRGIEKDQIIKALDDVLAPLLDEY